MSTLTAPHVLVTWTASAITTAFGGYRVYRRPARAVAQAWVQIAEITVPTGYTAATVEAQHNSFRDYEAGWGLTNGTWADGWDYAVTYLNATTGLESGLSNVDSRNVVPVETPWVVTNTKPYLNTPLEVLQGISVDEPVRRTVHETADADFYSVRTEIRKPGRTFNATFEPFAETGWDQLRQLEALQESGDNICLHTRLGDRIIGPLALTGAGGRRVRRLPTGLNVVETSRDLTGLADYNRPAGLVLDGTSDYITHADNDLLDPGTGDFSVVVAAVFPNALRVALSKRTAGGADGYFVTPSGANQMLWSVNGDGSASNVTATDSSATWFDGNMHVAVGTRTSGNLALYRDGVTSSPATGSGTIGSVANAAAFVVGADTQGSTLWSALAPLRAYAYYGRLLTTAEIQAASYYLLGYPGYRMPAGASLFVDLRDNRCWDGISTSAVDLSGNSLTGTITGGPATRGIPTDLSVLT